MVEIGGMACQAPSEGGSLVGVARVEVEDGAACSAQPLGIGALEATNDAAKRGLETAKPGAHPLYRGRSAEQRFHLDVARDRSSRWRVARQYANGNGDGGPVAHVTLPRHAVRIAFRHRPKTRDVVGDV